MNMTRKYEWLTVIKLFVGDVHAPVTLSTIAWWSSLQFEEALEDQSSLFNPSGTSMGTLQGNPWQGLYPEIIGNILSLR